MTPPVAILLWAGAVVLYLCLTALRDWACCGLAVF
jgi:hypothetical protein